VSEHKELDDWIKTKLSMSDKLKLIHESQFNQMKTAIIESSDSREVWIIQSTINYDCIESYVDVIMLHRDDIKILINKKSH
jgi:hypothetical protein